MGAYIGGTVATNASGARTYRYGATRNWVRLLRVMLASGEILEIPRGKYFASPNGEFIITDSKGYETTVTIPNYAMPVTKTLLAYFPHQIWTLLIFYRQRRYSWRNYRG